MRIDVETDQLIKRVANAQNITASDLVRSAVAQVLTEEV